ncbi:protocadherin beta-13-like [Argonauta hians]
MLLSFSIVSSLLWCVWSVDLTYHVEEERSPGTYVADIAADSKLLDNVKPSDQQLITFSQFKRKVAQLFNITKTGKLYTAQTLDAEELCTFNKECSRTVKVVVNKGMSVTKILKIKIIIQDINDHEPEFPMKKVDIQFDEDIGKGTKRSIPNAIDKDIGFENSFIQYKLKTKNGEPFSLSVSKRADGISTLKIVLKESLDRELKETYLLHVIAKDGGSPPKQGVLHVNISVMDENDNPPVFSKPFYNVSIQSTHHRTKPVIILSVTDADSGENAKVTFHFSPKTSDLAKSYFQLNETSGNIFLSKYKNVGEKKTYELFIEARDGGNPPLNSIATVLVNVINQHNNPPSIDIDYVSSINDNTATISEKIKVGSFIAYVMVTDNDVGQNGQVSCDIKHDTFKLQSMGSKEYKIILNKPVDRETQGHYNIPVSCQDKGLPPLKSVKTLSIQVTDINDVQPEFTKDTFQFLTYENKDKDFPIGFVNATDPDLGSAGQLTYSLLHPQKSTLPFVITSYGFISASKSLDREKQDVYKFEVFVKDNGSPSLNDTANVVVEILDQNDNAPYFTFPSVDPYTLNVNYHPQSKSDITVLRASDGDSGNNAFLTYGIISGNAKQLFTMNSHSGALSFSRQVYLNDAGTYDIKFVVKDSGSPVQSSTTTVTLVLAVSNETSPMMKSGPLQLSGRVHMTWVIIIVSSAVIVSVTIVISITLCIMKCIKHRDNTCVAAAATSKSTAYQGRTEMKQLLYQSNNPVGMSRTTEEMVKRNIYSERSKSECYSEGRLPNKYESSIQARTLPKPTPKYCQPVVVTSTDDPVEDNGAMVCNYTSDTMSSKRSSRRGDMKHYEEIPVGTSDQNIYKNNDSPTSKDISEETPVKHV